MPQNPVDFSKEMPEWSRWKHAILSGYLARFSGILQYYDTVFFIDGFAGAGQYEDGSKGSALRAAKMAKNIENDPKRKYKLRCINVEQDERVFVSLVESTTEYELFITNYLGNFSEYVDDILSMIGEQPALFFLDPFGVKGLEWKNLLSILRRNPTASGRVKTEILIRYDAQAMSRLAGCINNDDDASKKNVERFLEIFGFSDILEFVRFGDEHSITEIRYLGEFKLTPEVLTDAYRIRLQQYFDYVVQMPIRKTDTGQLKYYLIFATRSPKAISVMNDMLYEVEDIRDKVSIVESPQSFLPGLEPTRDILSELEALKRIILKVLSIGESIRRASLITKVTMYESNFGAFSGTHFTAVLGGRTRKIKVPKEFETLKDDIETDGALSNDKTIITRIK